MGQQFDTITCDNDMGQQQGTTKQDKKMEQ